MTHPSDTAAELRAGVCFYGGVGDGVNVDATEAVMNRAADEIERLRAKCAALEDALSGARPYVFAVTTGQGSKPVVSAAVMDLRAIDRALSTIPEAGK